MKIIITTVYENIDQEWLDWYLEYLDEGTPETRQVSKEFRAGEKFASFKNCDPTSKTSGSTSYELSK